MATTQPNADATYSHDPQLNDLPIEDGGPQELQELFAQLRERGIVTIEGTSCCTGCTAAAAGGYIDDLEEQGDAPRGYAGYHQQDLNYRHYERTGRYQEAEEFYTYETDYIHVAYDGNGDTPAAAIAGEIMAAAADAGLEAEWSGDTATKVKINLY